MKLFAGAEADNSKAATRLASDMGEFFMPFPGTRINQESGALGTEGMPGAYSSYEVKFTDTNKPTGQIWAGVVGNATPTVAPGQPMTPRGQRNERWFVVWLGTANNPVDKGAAATLANSIRPWSPPAPPPPDPKPPRRRGPERTGTAADPNAPPPTRMHRLRRQVHRGVRRSESASRSIRPPHRGCCPRAEDNRKRPTHRVGRFSFTPRLILFVSDSTVESLRFGRIPEVGPAAALGADRQEIAEMDALAATELLARSTTLTSVGWIGYIIIGALAGLDRRQDRQGRRLRHSDEHRDRHHRCAHRRFPVQLLPRHCRRAGGGSRCSPRSWDR